jgi:hypothetical protein
LVGEKTKNGKVKIIDINDRLDDLLDNIIPKFKNDYLNKNSQIEACDSAFD